MGKLARIINIDDVTIEAVDDPESPGTTVSATITAKTFIFLEEPEDTAQEQEAGA